MGLSVWYSRIAQPLNRKNHEQSLKDINRNMQNNHRTIKRNQGNREAAVATIRRLGPLTGPRPPNTNDPVHNITLINIRPLHLPHSRPRLPLHRLSSLLLSLPNNSNRLP